MNTKFIKKILLMDIMKLMVTVTKHFSAKLLPNLPAQSVTAVNNGQTESDRLHDIPHKK
jgi:hypothetical protein